MEGSVLYVVVLALLFFVSLAHGNDVRHSGEPETRRSDLGLSGFQQLVSGINLANTLAKSGKVATIKLTADVAIIRALPLIQSKANLVISSNCKTAANLPRKCVIDGKNKFSVFNSIPVPDASCVLTVDQITVVNAAGSVFAASCKITVTNSLFANSSSTTGGSVISTVGDFGPGPATPPVSFTNSAFVNNKVTGKVFGGGAVLKSGNGKYGLGSYSFTRCSFTGNSAAAKGLSGGAIYVEGSGQVTLIQSTFNGNYAGSDGGAIYSLGSNIRAAGTLFANNKVIYGRGSALYVSGNFFSQPTLKLCRSIFTANGKAGSDIFLEAVPAQVSGTYYGGKVILCNTAVRFTVPKFWTLSKSCPAC